MEGFSLLANWDLLNYLDCLTLISSLYLYVCVCTETERMKIINQGILFISIVFVFLNLLLSQTSFGYPNFSAVECIPPLQIFPPTHTRPKKKNTTKQKEM